MRIRALSLWWGIVSLCLLCSLLEAGERLVVSSRGVKKNTRLAPALELVLESHGELVGVNEHGRAIFNSQANLKETLQSMEAVVRDETPTDAPLKKLELLIRYADNEKPSDDSLAKASLKRVDKKNQDHTFADQSGGFLVVESTDEKVTSAMVQVLLDDSAVRHVEPNYIVSVPHGDVEIVTPPAVAAVAATTPNDPLFDQLWGMQTINAPKAWTRITSAPKVIVAIIDTGIDYNHPDLKQNLWKSASGKYGYDFFDDDDDPMDENNHGTHCAGTIAGIGNNSIGVVGVNWEAKVMALRFLGPDGKGSTSDAVKCIDWAVANGAHVLSNSWGGGGFSQELADAVTRAEKKGILFVAAAGNTTGGNDNDTNPGYPSSLPNPNIMAVAAIDSSDAIASFSHFGKKSVDIGAPGVGIISSIRDSKYAKFNGTSMATPHVAGAVALTWAQNFSNPAQDPKQSSSVRDLVFKNARPVTALTEKWGNAGSSVAVPGGVLDIAFLKDGTPKPTTPKVPAQCAIGSAQFAFGAVTANKDKSIAKASIQLDQPSIVHITANSSVQGSPTTMTTGFATKEAPDQIRIQSQRFVTIKQPGEWVNFGSTASVQLDKGTHTIYWMVVVNGANLKFDSGSMLIQAFPLPENAAGVAKAGIEQ